MRARLPRRVVVALLAGGVLAAAVLVPLVFTALRSGSSLRAAADTSQFDPGNVITDQVFFASQSMGASDVDAFIRVKGASCVAGFDGTPCLKNFRMDTTSRAADAYCNGYTGASGETAGTIIARVATSCGISPRVLLVMLQKEQGLLTAGGSGLYASRYRIAMGFGCPDTAACDTTYYGFQNQVYSAARQMKLYGAKPTSYSYRAGRTVNVYWNPNPSCGYAPLTIANQATADLYNYTPYQPNAAALAAGYGAGDACSSYGNRNFWLYYTDWFGSTQYDAMAISLPKGTLDVLSSSYGQITATGWAIDPDVPAESIQVHVYVDGSPVMASTADRSRPDVGAVFPGAGALHGYQATFPYGLGRHQVCVYAINAGAGTVNPQLACATVDNQDPGAPIGTLDVAESPEPNVIEVSGWAVDADSRSAQLAVHVYVDDALVTAFLASGSRPDMAAAVGTDAAHGYSGRVQVAGGQHTVCTYAINVGLGVTNSQLGCRQVAVHDASEYNPQAVLDTVSAAGGTVSLSGWGFDPDTPGAPIALHVYVDGTFLTQIGTGVSRPDVAQARPSAGPASGFAWQGILPAGRHAVCVFAINTGYGTLNPLLGCGQVTTIGGVAANPVGHLDTATGGIGSLAVTGWADDPDQPAAALAVHVYVDGTLTTAVAAAGDRPDVGSFLGGTAGPAHGFSWTGAVAPGRHTVCVYGINVGAGTGNPQLGCATVTVLDPASARDPVGALDAVTTSGTTGTATGWALDPDLGQQPATVHVDVDGTFRASVSASASRPDVGALFPDAGAAHGYSWSGTLAAGRHTVCVYAMNSGAGTGVNPLLGCRVVSVG